MRTYVALLRAVNVGGTGRLPMQTLRTACSKAGLWQVKTYIASGNIIFQTEMPFDVVANTLHKLAADLVGKPVDVFLRSVADMVAIVDHNPFPDAPPQQVLVNFFHDPVSATLIDELKQRSNEQVALGDREVFVHYPSGMGQSKMRWPASVATTGRNVRTVNKLVEMATT